ncbi:MAG: FxsA family protein [Betaproteobacteria bacterium]|nr:FxsA family protein [Betaproteobacteria bacterium]
MRFLALLIVTLGFPALELAGIVWIWQWAGWWTLAWLGFSILAGISVLRVAQAEMLPRLMFAALEGRAPLAVLWEGGRHMLAGVLLLLPGAISDAVALVLLLWPGPRGPRGPMAANDDFIEGEYRRLD